ncbi:FAD assembly factor SdhE [Photobacterium leiognathi]|uniref:FAD assembly factor SdhE n=1 Tax=Photobacterium leiognathi TaxID=553611 RepID=UPI0027388FA0|nr:succinate dehydrogenase assembly factor 2 [Photobacterium leiognathi]
MLSAEDKARVKWACRRGMLELDVIIMPFFEERFEGLSEQQQQDFINLLTCDDPDLFTWMMQHGRSDNEAYANMVDMIVAHNNSKLR